MIEPIATTVAGAEPEMAAKNMQARIETFASPPYMPPTTFIERSISLFDIPPHSMSLPAIINSGIAKSVKESVPVNILCTSRSSGTLPSI